MIELTIEELWRLILIIVGGLGGTTFAVATKHLTGKNYTVHPEDKWYYVLAAGASIGAFLFGGDWTSGFLLTSGINTPLALMRNAIQYKQNGTTKAMEIEALTAKLAKLKG